MNWQKGQKNTFFFKCTPNKPFVHKMLHMTKYRNWHHLTAVQSCSHSPWIMRILTHFQDRGDKPDASPKAASLKLSKNILKNIRSVSCRNILWIQICMLYIIVYICAAWHSDLGHLADNCPLWWNKSLWSQAESIFMNYIYYMSIMHFL